MAELIKTGITKLLNGVAPNINAYKIEKETRKIGWSICRGILLFCMSFVLLYPLIYMISVAFRPQEQIFDPTVIWVPKSLTWDNIITAYKLMEYPTALKHTAILGIVSSILQVISCAVVGYGFARFKFKGKSLLFAMVIFTIIVPPQTVIIPLYIEYRFFDFFGLGRLIGLLRGEDLTANLLNTVWAFYLPAIFGVGIRSGLFIYMFRQFFRGMPVELEDAAYVDGCGPVRTFIKVMVPNAAPVFLTVFLFSLVWYWNDYFFTSMFSNQFTVSTVLTSRQVIDVATSQREFSIAHQQAGCLLAIMPVLTLYIFLQKYFTESIERTGIVG